MKLIDLKYGYLFIVIFGLLWCAVAHGAEHGKKDSSFYIVKNGAPSGVIVLEQHAPAALQRAARELQEYIKQATGAMLSIVSPAEAALAKRPAQGAVLLVGPSTLTESLHLNGGHLPVEAYHLQTVGRYLVFLGHDYPKVNQPRAGTGHSPTTLWAVNAFLDRQLGVRWLWPGELGTYVPTRKTLLLPQLNVTRRPALLNRRLRYHMHPPDQPGLLTRAQYVKLDMQMNRWADRHEMGSRSHFRFGHAFTHWWKKYHIKHRDYFAKPPAGKAYQDIYKRMDTTRVKLDVSNPAVANQIVANWQAAGAPDNWDVCPNDGVGFSTNKACLAMDVPANQNPIAIWRGKAKLTARYVKFWNRLLIKMRAINPKVTLSSYAYSAYRDPPPPGVALHPGMVLGIVNGFGPAARRSWRKWHEAGAKLYLRPNWWHTGGVAPFLPLHEEGDYFIFARDHGMVGFDFDSIMGYWSTQGMNYYLIARLSQRPDLSVDDVINEYASAFKEASGAIKDYLAYWEQFTKRAGYAIPAGGSLVQNPHGLFETAVRKHHLSSSPLVASWQVIPFLYTDSVIDGGMAILNRAMRLLPENQPLAKARVAFLEAGLKQLRLTRDVLRLGYSQSRPAGATKAQFQHLAKQLRALRKKLSPMNVLWADHAYQVEKRRHVPTVLERTHWPKQAAPAGGA